MVHKKRSLQGVTDSPERFASRGITQAADDATAQGAAAEKDTAAAAALLAEKARAAAAQQSSAKKARKKTGKQVAALHQVAHSQRLTAIHCSTNGHAFEWLLVPSMMCHPLHAAS